MQRKAHNGDKFRTPTTNCERMGESNRGGGERVEQKAWGLLTLGRKSSVTWKLHFGVIN